MIYFKVLNEKILLNNYKKRDIDGLVKAIEKIKQNGKEFYSNACVLRAQKFFNKDDKFKEYIDLYESLLNNKTEK